MDRTTVLAFVGLALIAAAPLGCGGGSGGGGAPAGWIQSASGENHEVAYAVAALPDGSCIATGYFHLAVEFGAGASGTVLSATGQDAFLARYAPDGTLTWAKQIGGTGGCNGRGICALADGSFLVAGRFSGDASFGEGGSAVVLTARGEIDAFLARYQGNGSLVWVRQAGGTSSDEAMGVSAFPDGSCAVIGHFEGTATFGEGIGAVDLTAAVGANAFVARYGADGTFAWVEQGGGSEWVEGSGVGAFADGSCVVTGAFYFDVTFGEGLEATTLTAADLGAYIVRYEADGSLAWAREFHSAENNRGNAVAALADGSCLVAGWFYVAATLGEGLNEVNLTSHGVADAFLARYDAAGSLLWARNDGGVLDDRAYAVSAFADGSCLLGGHFSGVGTFGEGAGAVHLTSYGVQDAFVGHYDADGAVLWAAGGGGTDYDRTYGVAASTGGSGYAAGQFIEQATFGEGADAVMLPTGAGNEIFVVRYLAGGPKDGGL